MSKRPSVEKILDGSAIIIDFYLKNVRFSTCSACFIPQIGDEVRLRGVVYKVKQRIFFYDEEEQRVALTISPLAKKYQPKKET